MNSLIFGVGSRRRGLAVAYVSQQHPEASKAETLSVHESARLSCCGEYLPDQVS